MTHQSTSSPSLIQLATPYLLFVGDASDLQAAKTSNGIAHWRPDWCIGQHRYPDCPVDLGLRDLSLKEARGLGAKTLILGTANAGGIISPRWRQTLHEALDLGYDIASGLHDRLQADPELVSRASANGARLYDVRYATPRCPVGTGERRQGRRMLTIGTDCSVGKMFTTLAMEKEMHRRQTAADFVATGQTGIFICGRGAAIDAVIADFISGTVEVLSPSHPDPEHWDLIEGQGSLFHPAYAGVSLGLLHGAQADALILCHDPSRPHMRKYPGYPQPDIRECIRRNEEAARLTNPAARVVACSLNTSQWEEASAQKMLEEFEKHYALPTTDAYRFGAGKLVDAMIASR
jgi:uncharacterized NAD-dependent epimerase/dehydratase family protein